MGDLETRVYEERRTEHEEKEEAAKLFAACRTLAKVLALKEWTSPLQVVEAATKFFSREHSLDVMKVWNELGGLLGTQGLGELGTLEAARDALTKAATTKNAAAPDDWAGLMSEADEIVVAKGRDYTKGSDDRLANFKTSGADAGIRTLQAWLVLYNKHHAAICSYVKTNGQSESEPIKGRFVDALNYLRLGWLIVHEELGKSR